MKKSVAMDQVPFDDYAAIASSLAKVLAAGPPNLGEMLAVELAESSAPDRAVVRLERFLDACGAPEGETARMAGEPAYTRMLLRIFSQSNFLTDIVLRHPDYAAWLWQDAGLDTPPPCAALRNALAAEQWGCDSYDGLLSGLRRFRQREMLRIAVRDIFRHAALEEVTADLSNLADAALETALDISRAELTERFGAPLAETGGGGAGFVVLAMGKLGGRELNFSSDIDLLFLYSDEGHTGGGTALAISNAEFFRRLGEMVIRALSEQTVEGIVFRVDMRLRPFGRAGPLACSIDSALAYYAEIGRAWERQALIKARPCAGDIPLGETLLERLRPVVFPRYFDDETLEDIRRTKQQAERKVASRGDTEREVKLGRGGIRDIEFTVQMLQMLNGGRFPDLRTRNTLEAIAALGRHDVLRPFDADTLGSNYVFLRQVEHRLQIEDGRQCHALPTQEAALAELGRRLGFVDAAAFLHVYRDRTESTRRILDRFLAAKGKGNLWVEDLLNPHSDGAAGLEQLAQMGFENPERARAELMQLATGTENKPFTRRTHQQFSAVAPFLLNSLAQTARPNAILTRLEQILGELHAPTALYELLRDNPVLCHFLVTLAANSDYLSTVLVRDPGLLDTLSSVDALDVPSTRKILRDELDSLKRAYNSDAALYRLRDGEMLRVAMRELVRGIRLAQVGDELTQLAEVVLVEALRQAREKVAGRYGETAIPFAILGLGKLGGWEMGYGSDLDLVFVYEAGHEGPNGMSCAEYFFDVASHTLRSLKEPTRYGVLYDIDARLRPDGGKGVLAIGDDRLRTYYLEDAQAWERLALMKGRAVAGDRDFMRKCERIAKEVAFSLPLNRHAIGQIESLRKKMVQHAHPLSLKKTEGGISEIEYATRLLQLRHVAQYPELKRGDVFGALDILEEYELAAPARCAVLREAYGALRRIVNRIRMQGGSQTARLPESGEARAELAERLGIQDELLAYTTQVRRGVHRVYRAIRDDVLGAA